MVSKCRAPVSELAVMEVDVRPRTTTRSPPPDFDRVISSPSSNNKRKNLAAAAAAAHNFDFSTTTTTTFVKLQSRRRRLVLPENNTVSTPPIIEEITTATTSPTSNGTASAFHCCSSNGCSHVVDESLKFLDLEDEQDEHGVLYKSSRERRSESSSTPSSSQFRSGAMESPAGKISEETSGNRFFSSPSPSAKMPAESELEEFFFTAEKNIQKRFAEKYNYDIVEDVPTEGRYEWIRLKP